MTNHKSNRKHTLKIRLATKAVHEAHPLYVNWNNMVQRCTNEKMPNFHRWGGRGIKIFKPWLKFSNYEKDILAMLGPKKEGMTIDRINNDGNYEPTNVRYATTQEQQKNKNHQKPK